MKKTIIALSVIAVLLLGVAASTYAYAFREIDGLSIEMNGESTVEPVKAQEAVKNRHETPKPAKKSQESPVLEQETAPKPQPVQSAPVKQKAQTETPKSRETGKQQMERIPFTNKDVTPGDPMSYDGTYGQCPFYENAMSGKGCVPPAHIECNDDWSVCTFKDESDDN